uniref:Glycosyltransferase n=1 Tax=viral metagenome TaxID=1070528 RepID=A0A6M3L261_9ZZZZ
MRANVLVFMPCDDQYDFAFVQTYLNAIQLPKGIGEYRIMYQAFKNIVGARNMAAKFVVDNKYTHLFFMDSDNVYKAGTLVKLLSHDVDVVGGVYVKKIQPHYVTVFRRNEKGLYHFFPPQELCEVDALATGCMLIKREVLERLKPPWFYYKPSEIRGYEWATNTEDMTFCENVKASGMKIYVDGSVHVGHVGKYVVWPDREDRVRVEPYKNG